MNELMIELMLQNMSLFTFCNKAYDDHLFEVTWVQDHGATYSVYGYHFRDNGTKFPITVYVGET
jgi:hypothetical protein